MPPKKKVRFNTDLVEVTIEKKKLLPKTKKKLKRKLQDGSENMTIGTESSERMINRSGLMKKKKPRPPEVPRKIKFVRFTTKPEENSTKITEMPPKKKMKFNSNIQVVSNEKITNLPKSIQKKTNLTDSVDNKTIRPKKKVVFKTELNQIKIIPHRGDSFFIQVPHHDTIGQHLMALRTFYRGLVHYRKRKLKSRKLLQRPYLPPYPKDYPTSSYLYSLRVKRSKTNERAQINFEKQIEESRVNELRNLAVKRILVQLGFKVSEDEVDITPVEYLSYVTDIFLKSFTERIRFHKESYAFHGDDDLWNSLETTLQEWGFHGVRGIAKYFYDEFVQTTETLHDKCVHMYQEFKVQEKAEKEENRLKKMKKKAQTIKKIDSTATTAVTTTAVTTTAVTTTAVTTTAVTTTAVTTTAVTAVEDI